MILVLLAALMLGAPAAADPAMRYAHCGSGSGLQNQYIWKVLEAALEATRGAYGDYRLDVSEPMPQRRQIRALKRGDPPITIGMFTADADLEKFLIPVRIPIDRGLLGYRILLIREEDEARFASVSSLQDLRDVRFGLMPVWDDDPVMRAAGLTVVPGGSHEGLFHMLMAGRFDAFSRGVTEILPEYEHAGRGLSGLAVERHLLLHYPLPLYFWFSDNEEGRRLAERVQAGLEKMAADGSLRKMFDEEFGPLFARLDLAHRQVIELPNPLLSGKDPLNDPRLWYRPHG